MGLDMYLSAKKYVSGWNHSSDTEKSEYRTLLNAFGLNGSFKNEGCPSGYLELTVAYWRKANAVHAWFVREAQDGSDECQISSVSREQLASLLELCRTVKAEPEKAPELLPTQSGFFFGGTDYYESYFAYDIGKTIEQLESVLAEPAFKDCEFYYHASW